MKIRFAVYNMEWMKNLFYRDGTPKRSDQGSNDDKEDGVRSEQLATVVRTMKPDILCVVEGPDTLKNGSKTASGQLQSWCDLHALADEYRSIQGLISGGQQELCALYRTSKIKLIHDPEKNAKKNPFDQPFLVDTLESLIKEQYKHYRPPLELSVRKKNSPDAEIARIIVAHTKSKGIFDSVDLARYEQLSERNRRKLFAECCSIRQRCNQWLSDKPNQKIIVCGDFNDGFGLDYYESRFSKSAVDILLGDVWSPESIFKHVLPKPKLNKYGWSPSSSRYKDRITGDYFNVLIDHILVSQNIPYENAMVWNPYPDNAPDNVKAIKKNLVDASDHFPVSVDLTL
jgi:predicted extracellular nuclease